MIDILIYLLHSYPAFAAQPLPDKLVHQLKAAGFESDEIETALEWLGTIAQADLADQSYPPPRLSGIRVFAAPEVAALGVEGLSLLLRLEQTGHLDLETRELIIDRVMSFGEAPVSTRRLRVVTLAVLWRRSPSVDPLLVEELLTESTSRLH